MRASAPPFPNPHHCFRSRPPFSDLARHTLGQEWMRWIHKAIEVAESLDKEYELARARVNTPRRIQQFDRLETDDAKRQAVGEEVRMPDASASGRTGTLDVVGSCSGPQHQPQPQPPLQVDMIFGSCDGKDVDCLSAAIDNATTDLRELASDCEAAEGHGARADVLAFQLHLYARGGGTLGPKNSTPSTHNRRDHPHTHPTPAYLCSRYHERVLDEVYPFFAPTTLDAAENTLLYQLIYIILRSLCVTSKPRINTE